MPYRLLGEHWLLQLLKKQSIDNLGRIAPKGDFQFDHRPFNSKRDVAPKGNHEWERGNARPRVLVVDDDPDIRVALCDLLEKNGYACIEAEHGVGAVEKLLASPVDVLITDYQMPVMDGLQLIEWLEKASRQNHPPVILLTGDINERVQERAKRGGVLAILPKPYVCQDLLSALIRALRR